MSAFRVKANVGNWRCFDIADRSLLVGAVDAAMVRIGGRSVNRLRQCSFLVGNIPRARGYVVLRGLQICEPIKFFSSKTM